MRTTVTFSGKMHAWPPLSGTCGSVPGAKTSEYAILSLFMPRSEDRDTIPEQGKLCTPADLLMLYVREQKPVNVDALRVMIEPLAGTSFGTIALSALQV